jgi:hypothetical protein
MFGNLFSELLIALHCVLLFLCETAFMFHVVCFWLLTKKESKEQKKVENKKQNKEKPLGKVVSFQHYLLVPSVDVSQVSTLAPFNVNGEQVY